MNTVGHTVGIASAGITPDAARFDQDVKDLTQYTDSEYKGFTREVLSDPYRASREFVRERMAQAGLEVSMDGGGNIVGVLRGRRTGQGLKPLVTGSHTDTVKNGGRFDGVVGVLGAVEMVRAMRESGVAFDRDLWVLDFLGEEPNEFGISCMGSRSVAGQLTAEHLSMEGTSGQRLGHALERYGVDPGSALANAWGSGSVHAYLELHIEQGPQMERAEKQIGVVTAIAGIDRLMARFMGEPDHAGATPMDARHDALSAAAESILAVEREGCGAPVHGVTTTGRIESWPGSFNVVPEETRIYAELRSVERSWLTGTRRRIAEDIAAAADRRGVSHMIEWLSDQDPVPTSPAVRDVIAGAAESLGLSWMPVPSGAGHDAAHMAHLGPMGMIFVPSVAGHSHRPDEFTHTSDILAGITVLHAALARLDQTSVLVA